MIADEYEEESAGLDDLDAASDEEEEDGKEEQRKCGLQQHTVGFEFKCFKKMVLGQGWQTCMGNDPGAVSWVTPIGRGGLSRKSTKGLMKCFCGEMIWIRNIAQ